MLDNLKPWYYFTMYGLKTVISFYAGMIWIDLPRYNPSISPVLPFSRLQIYRMFLIVFLYCVNQHSVCTGILYCPVHSSTSFPKYSTSFPAETQSAGLTSITHLKIYISLYLPCKLRSQLSLNWGTKTIFWSCGKKNHKGSTLFCIGLWDCWFFFFLRLSTNTLI